MRVYRLKAKKTINDCIKTNNLEEKSPGWYIETYLCFIETVLEKEIVIDFLFPLNLDDTKDILLKRLNKINKEKRSKKEK